jgi:hypothetical protein
MLVRRSDIYLLSSMSEAGYLSICGSTAFCGPWPFFYIINMYTVGRTPWTENQPAAKPLPTHRTTQTQNKRTQTSLPRVGFEPMITVFE